MCRNKWNFQYQKTKRILPFPQSFDRHFSCEFARSVTQRLPGWYPLWETGYASFRVDNTLTDTESPW